MKTTKQKTQHSMNWIPLYKQTLGFLDTTLYVIRLVSDLWHVAIGGLSVTCGRSWLDVDRWLCQWLVLLVEETRVPEENNRPAASHWKTLSHNVVSSTPRLSWIRTHNVSSDRHWLRNMKSTIYARSIGNFCWNMLDDLMATSLWMVRIYTLHGLEYDIFIWMKIDNKHDCWRGTRVLM